MRTHYCSLHVYRDILVQRVRCNLDIIFLALLDRCNQHANLHDLRFLKDGTLICYYPNLIFRALSLSVSLSHYSRLSLSLSLSASVCLTLDLSPSPHLRSLSITFDYSFSPSLITPYTALAPALYTFYTFAASCLCSTLKLPPPLLHTLPTRSLMTVIPSFSTSKDTSN